MPVTRKSLCAVGPTTPTFKERTVATATRYQPRRYARTERMRRLSSGVSWIPSFEKMVLM